MKKQSFKEIKMEEKKKDVFSALYPKLREYLVLKGVQIDDNGFLSCIHPNHDDAHPSCSIGGKTNEIVFHCFSCNCAGNIFHAVHFLDKKPITGIGLYQDTIPYLCKLFDIPYEPIEISEDQKREFQKRRAYEDAVNVITSMSYKKVDGKRVLNKEHPAIKHLLDRGITEETIKRFQIGCIDSYSQYIEEMKVLGWSDRSYLEGADLANKKLFSPTGIIIPIYDKKGRPVGFVTRRTDMAANDKGDEKYVNSLNSDIYHKSEILFNYNNCKKEDGPLFIVEGYLDAVFLTQAGIPNVAAIGATVLTEEHVEMLFVDKFKSVIICLDADDGGRRGIKLAIERLSCYKNFKVRIMELPEKYDPDTYVREFGRDKFMELSKSDIALSPFTWMLKWTTFEDDPMETAKKAIPTIAAEESNIVRLQMIRELSRLTAVDETDIRKDVDSLVNKESSKFLEELADINNFVQVQLQRRKTRDTKSILEESILKVKSLEKQYNNEIDNRSEFLSKLDQVKNRIESGEFKYGMRANKFRSFYEMFDGIPYTTCLSLIGGRPSAGKTMWMTALSLDIIDTEDDAAIFYMSIDDTTELMTLKILAMKSGLSTSQIKTYSTLNPEQKYEVDQAWRWFETHSDRFILADATAGNTIDALESHVDWFVKNFKTPKRLFLLDNFHKLRFSSGGRAKKTDAVSDGSERIKELTQLNDLHIMATAELRKLEGSQNRPQLADLKDSVQLEYDADIIALVHNDKQVKEDTYIVWQGPGRDGLIRAMPYVEVNVWKNKITGQTQPLAYQLNDYNLSMMEVPASTIRALRDAKSDGGNQFKAGNQYRRS
jgi:DNA primase